MRAVCESIYERGKRGIKYLRRRVPSDLCVVYGRTHITRSLGTSDLREAKSLAHAEQARLEEEFQRARGELEGRRERLRTAREQRTVSAVAPSTAATLTEPMATVLRLVERGEAAGAFAALAAMLAPGASPGQPAVLSDPGPVVVPSAAAVSAPIDRAEGRGAVSPEARQLPSWDEVFATWRDYVPDRPRSTAIAAQTPWRHLHRLMCSRSAGGVCPSPALVTPVDMTAFVEDMRSKGLAVDTLNERLSKVKAVYRIAVGRHVLTQNPAQNTLGLKESSAKKRRKRRLPFDTDDLDLIFGSDIYTKHLRSSGQSGEASYWLPVLLYYTGARPEEVAGMALQDIVQAADGGWYFNIVDRPSGEDHDLFEDVPQSHRRTLKNGHSIRRVPVAHELIDLGLLRYMEWLRGQGKTVLFPTLEKDWHGKLSGAFSKFFGRYKCIFRCR